MGVRLEMGIATCVQPGIRIGHPHRDARHAGEEISSLLMLKDTNSQPSSRLRSGVIAKMANQRDKEAP